MNPQAKIMNNNGILNMVINAVNAILSKNSPQTMSSNELLRQLPPVLYKQLYTISGRYLTNCACKQPASYVGTAAAMLAKTNPLVFHDRHFFCPVLQRYDDAFRI
jgi:hypothetical protein